MAWVDSQSKHFFCRHSSAFDADAARVLALLERTREDLREELPRIADGLTVILHDTPLSLALSHPMMMLSWRAASPAARRYVTGWAGKTEIHVLSPQALRERASGVSGSFEMLRLSPASLYTRRMISESNIDLQTAREPLRRALETKWAWLLEGASRWLSGESEYSRGVVGVRVREGQRITFPPSSRDAPILGATVMEVLATQQGDEAVAQLCLRLPADGAEGALYRAFGGRAIMNIESDWRQYLRQVAGI